MRGHIQGKVWVEWDAHRNGFCQRRKFAGAFRHLAALRKMIVPAVVSQLIVLIYNMADTFFVGQTNNPYMVAGTSLILPVFNITLCLAGLAGIGGGSLIARLLGQAKEQEARRVSAFSFYLALGIAALFSVGIAVFMHPILRLLGAGKTPTNTPGNTRFA